MKFVYNSLALLLILLVSACKGKTDSSKNNTSSDPAPIEHSSANTPETSGVLKLANISLSLPEGWKQVQPSSQMRMAEIKLDAHPDYEIAVFYFGEQNMTEANIERWKGQYTQLDTYEELESSIENMTAVKLEGTFKLKPFPMAQDFKEVPGYATLAAIVPTQNGPYYLKVSGPQDIINAQVQHFMAMLNSYQTIE